MRTGILPIILISYQKIHQNVHMHKVPTILYYTIWLFNFIYLRLNVTNKKEYKLILITVASIARRDPYLTRCHGNGHAKHHRETR